MPSRTRFRRVRLGLTVLFGITFTLASGATLHAQVISDPRVAEFDPSRDHSAVLDDGQPAVLRYDLELFVAGSATPFGTVDMGKPSPDPDGKIRYDFSSQVATWSLPGGNLEARVSAVGPEGAALSAPSNLFTFTAGSTCTISLSATTRSVSATGGSYAVDVSTGTTCGWTATTTAPWMTLSTVSGSGSWTVPFAVQANPSTSTRTGIITIGGQTLTVTQAGAAPTCSYGISPKSTSLPAAGGWASFVMTAGTGCSWTAATVQSWISISGSSGSGGGTVSLTVAANPTTATRTGTVTVQGQIFTVAQAPAGNAFVGPANGGGYTGTISGSNFIYNGVSYRIVNGNVNFPNCTTYAVTPYGALFSLGATPSCTATPVAPAAGSGTFVGPTSGGGYSGTISGSNFIYKGVAYPIVNGTVNLPDCRTYAVTPFGGLFFLAPTPNCTPGAAPPP